MNTTVTVHTSQSMLAELEGTDDLPTLTESAVLDDGFDDLNALLDRAMSAKEDAAKIKLARSLLARGKLPVEERNATKKLIEQWDLAREWLPTASVQMFSTQTCTACGGTHHHFMGIYQRQVHRHNTRLCRWILSDAIANKGLPFEAKCEESFAPVCADCSPAFEDA